MLKGTPPDKAPQARKRKWERRLRHASRIAKPKRPLMREGKPLGDDGGEGRILADDLADQRAWMDS